MNDVSIHNVQTAVESLKLGKSCGPDGIFTEAIAFGGSLLIVDLVIQHVLVHSYLLRALTMTSPVPLIENQSGDIADSNNYRAIALSMQRC